MPKTGNKNRMETIPMKKDTFNEDDKCEKEEYTPLCAVAF